MNMIVKSTESIIYKSTEQEKSDGKSKNKQQVSENSIIEAIVETIYSREQGNHVIGKAECNKMRTQAWSLALTHGELGNSLFS